jgi:hypothetical protein
VTTDGTVGALSTANIRSWNVTVTQTEVLDTFNQSNSAMLDPSALVTSDGRSIRVANPGGSWGFRKGFLEPSIVQLADFTDPNVPGGQAGYLGPFTSQTLSPLSSDASYVAASAVPEPSTLVMLSGAALTGLVATWLRRRRSVSERAGPIRLGGGSGPAR